MDWSPIYLLGAINSFFLALIVTTSRKSGNAYANRFLGLLLFSWSYGFLYTWVIETGLYLSFPHILLVGAPNTFLIGPCVFLYASVLIGPGRRFGRRVLLHGVPFFLHTLFLVPFYFQSGVEKILYWNTRRTFDSIFFFAVYLQLVHLFVYLAFTLRLVRRHSRSLPETRSSVQRVGLAWLRNVILSAYAGLAVYAGEALRSALSGRAEGYINRISDLFLFGVLHVIGYCGLVQPEIFHGFAGENPSSGEKAARYERSSLSEAQADEIVRKAEDHMRGTKAYLDGELSLQDLAEELDVSPHHLSQAINQRLGRNFFEYVNRFRIDHAKELLRASIRDKEKTSSLLDIAFASGFNSKSTFNALFKEYSGTTPREFRKASASV